mmetsp:Transcript_52718/g.151978  ORF Transcript_52718/g.151978 Transcript_52718/m.151978 type:complete len:267 (+) Transcript_52718:129-929(+)
MPRVRRLAAEGLGAHVRTVGLQQQPLQRETGDQFLAVGLALLLLRATLALTPGFASIPKRDRAREADSQIRPSLAEVEGVLQGIAVAMYVHRMVCRHEVLQGLKADLLVLRSHQAPMNDQRLAQLDGQLRLRAEGAKLLLQLAAGVLEEVHTTLADADAPRVRREPPYRCLGLGVPVLRVVRVDADAEPELAARLGGRVEEVQVGLQPLPLGREAGLGGPAKDAVAYAAVQARGPTRDELRQSEVGLVLCDLRLPTAPPRPGEDAL